MDSEKQFSCVIIGAGSLPIQCGDILLARGHVIRAVVSSDTGVKRWALGRQLRQLDPSVSLGEMLGREPEFDYLFSIVNEHILREDVLRLPRRLAVNYHDAPLPRYAGTHATSWALMNEEVEHGVTWHVISDLVDAGDVFQQRRVEVAPADTAFTLNTKCYEAAISSFTQLVDDLAAGRATARKQNLSERTFFARFKRPASGCVISWQRPASSISALVRALDFGPHPNPIGRPKLALGEDFFVVPEIDVVKSQVHLPPGTISRIGPDFVQIATAEHEVVLRRFLTPDGQTVPVPELAAKYGLREGTRLGDLDSAAAQRLESLYSSCTKHEAFWVRQLASLEPASLPFNHTAAPAVGGARYASAPFALPAGVVDFIQTCQEPQCLSDLLLAAYGAFIARLGNVSSFDVGYSDSALRSEVAGLDKFFATHLPLRLDINCAESFTNVLGAVRGQVELFRKHKTYARDLVTRYPQLLSPSETVVKLALPIVVEEEEEPGGCELPAGSIIALLHPPRATECRWLYDRERIGDEDVARMARCFATFLEAIVADPQQKVAHLPLLPEAERHKVLVEWNHNRTHYPEDQCIHQLVEAQVSRTPDAVALVFGERRLTYRELNRRANQLAHYLRSLGVGPEVLVGVCLERSVEMVVGLLAILKAGGAYVPLDPAYPSGRVAYMLADSQAPVLLTQQKLVPGLSGQPARVVCLDSDWQRIAQEPGQNPTPTSTLNNLAYVIYTSGSTGKPKGVAIERRSTVAFLHWAASVFTPEQLKGVLASTSICFDLSVYELFVPLTRGGTVILVENVLHLPASPAADEVTLINTVPSAISELLRIKGVPASVRTVNLAGEPLKTALVRQIYELRTVKEVYDLYGPSEDTTYSTFTLRDTGLATIGRPISNTQAYILDRYLQPVPVGVPGELYLGGDGLARGYLNRPGLTGERFMADPFSSEPAARIYKTGDLTRHLPTGEIEYLGRIDNQVKIRGFRIELGEIEAALSAHPLVNDSVVIAREDKPGDKRLVAYVVPKQGQPMGLNELRAHLKGGLPDYMVPSTFIELAEMPLTPNGKVDRKALPAPATTRSEAEIGFVPPRDGAEAKLKEIWEEVLDIRPIGITDNFFELGGDSLNAVHMVVQVEQYFNKNIPLAILFQAPTIKQLADLLQREEGRSASDSSLVPIQPNGSKPPFFCIHAGGGNVLFYRDLARRLGPDQPFYGLQARRIGGKQTAHDRVEDMAAYYLSEIRSVQPEGPYYLGGSSFGGLVAFEMARLIEAKGEKVALVALLDTGAPSYPKYLPGTTRLRARLFSLARRIQHHWDDLRLLDARAKWRYIQEKAGKGRAQFRRKKKKYKAIAQQGGLMGMLGAIVDQNLWVIRPKIEFYAAPGEMPEAIRQTENRIKRAWETYAPQFYPGRVTIFRASKQPLGIYPDPTLGWSNLAAELEIHEVPGHHGSIVAEPYVQFLAAKITSCMEAIRANGLGNKPSTSSASNVNPELVMSAEGVRPELCQG